MIFSSSSANWEKYSLCLCHIPEQIFPSSDDCFAGVTLLRPLTRSSSHEIGEGGFQNLTGWNTAQQINIPIKKMQNNNKKNMLSTDTAFRNLRNHKLFFLIVIIWLHMSLLASCSPVIPATCSVLWFYTWVFPFPSLLSHRFWLLDIKEGTAFWKQHQQQIFFVLHQQTERKILKENMQNPVDAVILYM